ncbi:MAG: creatininase family protein, partial [Halobacteriaceae archaeon]
MTWEDAEVAITEADFVVLPTGSIEQHSIHLPVSVDTLRADSLTAELAKQAPNHDLEMVVLPTLPYGHSEHHMPFAGTVSLSADTYQEVIIDIGTSLKEHDANRLLFVNCHGGNRQSLSFAADRLQRDHGLPTHFVHWTNFARDELQEQFGEDWGHAGEHETSVIELFYPELVREEKKEPQNTFDQPETKPYEYFDDLT